MKKKNPKQNNKQKRIKPPTKGGLCLWKLVDAFQDE